jgi:hypothetical protein
VLDRSKIVPVINSIYRGCVSIINPSKPIHTKKKKKKEEEELRKRNYHLKKLGKTP